MSLNIPGLADSVKTPQTAVAVQLGGQGASNGNAPRRIMLLAPMLAADLTGAAPSFSRTKGNRQVSGTAIETRVQVFSSDDATAKFGKSSMLHRMARSIFRQYPTAEIWATPVAEPAASVKANQTLVFVGTASYSGMLQIFIDGETIEVSVAVGDTAAALATRVATELLTNHQDCCVTAQVSTATVTFTAVHVGTHYNGLPIAGRWVSGTAFVDIGTSATDAFGITGAFGGTSLASGTGSYNVTTALASFSTERYHVVVPGFTDTTNILRVADDLESKSAATAMLWGECVAASSKSPANAIADSTTVNRALVEIVQQYNSQHDPAVIAAQHAAARFIGDSICGGKVIGQATDPASNLNGLKLRDVQANRVPTEYPSRTEVESMLANGITPLVPDPGRPGYVMSPSVITTRFKDSSGGYNYGVWKVKAVTVSHYVAERVKREVEAAFAGCKLKKDPTDGKPIRQQKVVTPSMIRAFVLSVLKNLEEELIISDVDDHLNELVAGMNSSNPQRVDLIIPELPIRDLDIIGLRVDQLA